MGKWPWRNVTWLGHNSVLHLWSGNFRYERNSNKKMGASKILIVDRAVFLTMENSDKKLCSSSEIEQFSLWGNTPTKKPGLFIINCAILIMRGNSDKKPGFGSRLLPRPTATTRSRKRSSSTLLWPLLWLFCGDHYCDCFLVIIMVIICGDHYCDYLVVSIIVIILWWSWLRSFCGDHHCNYHCDCFFGDHYYCDHIFFVVILP